MSKRIKRQSIRCKPIYIVIIFFILQFCSISALYSTEQKATDEGEKKNNIFNAYDYELGRVDKEGIIYNQNGSILGSVDGEGIIYNVSKIRIGKVEPDGSILNQVDTKLGSVNDKGEIFNISQVKRGYVKDIKDIKLIGGAARLILLKK
jgi:hypothetical protein